MTSSAQALVVVDMQVDYFQDDELARCRDDVVQACNTLAARARSAGATTVDVRTRHAADRSTWALNMREDGLGVVIEGTPGVEPVAGLELTDAVRIDKTRDSAFFRTDLEAQLRSRNVTTIALAGVSTESCIATTAADAYARDIRVVFVDEALASIDPQLHAETLKRLAGQYRQPTVTLDDLVFEA